MFENRQKMWSNRNHIASPKREATIHVSVTIKLHCKIQCNLMVTDTCIVASLFGLAIWFLLDHIFCLFSNM